MSETIKQAGDYLEIFNDLALLIWTDKSSGKFGWQIRKEYDDNNEAISWCGASYSDFKEALKDARRSLIQQMDKFPDF